MINQQLAILLDKYVTETISEQEAIELFALMNQPDNKKYVEDRMLMEITVGQYDRAVDENVKARIRSKLNNSLAELDREDAPVYSIKSKRVWAWAVAILLLVTAVVMYFIIQSRN